jgi:hypothetical protein
MSTVIIDADAVMASRVAAWLGVGGSWAAIAAAHGASDVHTFEREWAPRIAALRSATSTARRGHRVPKQLALFGLTDAGDG